MCGGFTRLSINYIYVLQSLCSYIQLHLSYNCVGLISLIACCNVNNGIAALQLELYWEFLHTHKFKSTWRELRNEPVINKVVLDFISYNIISANRGQWRDPKNNQIRTEEPVWTIATCRHAFWWSLIHTDIVSLWLATVAAFPLTVLQLPAMGIGWVEINVKHKPDCWISCHDTILAVRHADDDDDDDFSKTWWCWLDRYVA